MSPAFAIKQKNTMNRQILVYFCLLALVISGCKTIEYIPVNHTEYITVRDTTVLRDTTIKYKIEKQYVRDYTGLLDELVLETDYAIARAHVDTTAAKLSGSIENKEKTVEIKTQWKERLVYRDSIITKEVPVEVEVEKIVKVVPRFWKFFGLIGMLTVIAGVVLILRKFHII